MRFDVFAAAILAATLLHAPTSAQMSVQDRLANMERRIQYLEKRVADQDAVIQAKDRQIGKLSKAGAAADEAWYRNVTISGAVELEASHSDPYDGESTSDLALATASIGVGAKIHDWVRGDISLLYEEDDTPLEVDEATIGVAPPDGPWSLKGGQFYVPFGKFETKLISDPLTLEIGETRETALQAAFEAGGFSGSVYVFNGTNRGTEIENFGAAAGYAWESGGRSFAANVGYINDVGDSDNLQDVIAGTLGSNNVEDRVPAWTASVVGSAGGFTLIGEYLVATDSFQPGEVAWRAGGAKPEAWTVEAAYRFRVAGKDATVAVSYQATDEALALELPESRMLAGISLQINDNASIAVEWAHDEDYGVGDGGTGKSADTVTGQLAVGF